MMRLILVWNQCQRELRPGPTAAGGAVTIEGEVEGAPGPTAAGGAVTIEGEVEGAPGLTAAGGAVTIEGEAEALGCLGNSIEAAGTEVTVG